MIKAVDGISFTVHKGERIGIVGESGSGKSITCLSILNLKKHPDEVLEGKIIFQGQDLLAMDEKELNAIRGKEIAIIFQDSKTSLNPFFKISTVMVDNIRRHQKSSRKEAKAKAVELLRLVDFPDPEKRIDDYPAMLSGGMKQRVVIAIALACNPEVLIADEPTTALDVTIQAQVLEMMKKLKEKFNTATLLITHDLGVVAQMCQKVAILYAGEILESGSVHDIFKNTAHPYTLGLLGAIPNIHAQVKRLTPIEGLMPDPMVVYPGCSFCERCKYADAECAQSRPALVDIGGGHKVRCHKKDLFQKGACRDE